MKVPLGSVSMDMDSIYRHVIAFGATGSGKTAFFLMPFLHAVLQAAGRARDSKVGALVVDVKGDMVARTADVLARVGRSKDLLVLGRSGSVWFDPLRSIAIEPRAVAERIVEAATLNRRVHDEFFWVENARRLLYAAAVLAKAEGGGRVQSVEAVAQALSQLQSLRGPTEADDEVGDGNWDLLKKILRLIDTTKNVRLISETEAKGVRSYLKDEVTTLAPRTWGIIANYAQSFLSVFRDGKLADLLREGSADLEYLPELIIDRGKIVVVSLSNTFFGPGARALRDTIKTDFQRAVLQRFHLQHFDGQKARPVNRTRPVLLVCDEFAESITFGAQGIGDAFFLSEAREFRCACILASQGVSALLSVADRSVAVAHLLNNCATKLFLSTDCPLTGEALASWHAGNPPAGPASLFRLPGQTAVHSPQVSAQSLPMLSLGQGIMVTGGRPAAVIELKPLPPRGRP